MIIPNGLHQGHFESGNSGFLTSENWQLFFDKSEESAIKIFEMCFKNFENISLNDFFKISLSELNDNQKNLDIFVRHGGGTIFEYALLAKILGNNICNIIIHEPRNGLFLYGGEELLNGVSRGIYAFKNIDYIKSKIKEYEELLKIKINIGIEREDFETFKKGQEFRKDNKEIYRKFDYEVHSKHSMCIENENIPIDSTMEDFDRIYYYYNGDIKEIILAYVKGNIDIILNSGNIGDSLAHPDLISLPLILRKSKKENISFNESRDIVFSYFGDKEIVDKYDNLIEILREKNIKFGLNLALGYKIKDNISYYGKTIYDLLKKSQVKISLEKDTHSIGDEFKVGQNFGKIVGELNKLNIVD